MTTMDREGWVLVSQKHLAESLGNGVGEKQTGLISKFRAQIWGSLCSQRRGESIFPSFSTFAVRHFQQNTESHFFRGKITGRPADLWHGGCTHSQRAGPYVDQRSWAQGALRRRPPVCSKVIQQGAAVLGVKPTLYDSKVCALQCRELPRWHPHNGEF